MTRLAETASNVRVRFDEPFVRYCVDWQKTTARTDTPDLIALFKELIEDAASQAMMDAETLAIYEELAEASFSTLPPD